MSTHWTRPHVDGDPDDGLVVHTPEEAVVCSRVAGGWLAEVHTPTAEAVLLRKRWQQVAAPAPTVEAATSKASKRKGTS
jgi:hypothetical protein